MLSAKVRRGLRVLAVLVAGVLPAAPAAADPQLRQMAQALFAGAEAKPWVGGPVEELGRSLFFDTRIGSDGRTGCVSCHLPEQWGADGRAKSPDARGRLTERNSQTVFDVAALPALRWRGDRRSAAHQAADSIKGSMGYATQEDIVPVLERLGYAPRFAAAFPGSSAPVTPDNFGAALEAYQRTLVTRGAFDRFLAGDDDALGEAARRGLSRFVALGCVGCHSGPGFGGTTLQRFGVVRDYWTATGSTEVDPGRFAVTGQEADRWVFRVPVLRNVAKTGPYFHDGSVAGLRDAVRIMAEVQLGVTPTDGDLDDLVAFLESLTGGVPEQFRAPESEKGAGRGPDPLGDRG